MCGMKLYSSNDKNATLGYAEEQCKLELQHVNSKVNHAKAFGRIAFSCPASEVCMQQQPFWYTQMLHMFLNVYKNDIWLADGNYL